MANVREAHNRRRAVIQSYFFFRGLRRLCVPFVDVAVFVAVFFFVSFVPVFFVPRADFNAAARAIMRSNILPLSPPVACRFVCQIAGSSSARMSSKSLSVFTLRGVKTDSDFEDILAEDDPAIWHTNRQATGGDSGKMFDRIIARAAALKSARGTKNTGTKDTKKKTATKTATSTKGTQSLRSPRKKK